jgi:hypothetical protein
MSFNKTYIDDKDTTIVEVRDHHIMPSAMAPIPTPIQLAFMEGDSKRK